MATKLNEVTAADMRAAMIDSQLRTNDVIDPAVVAAMGSVAREAHVPAALASVAYMDRAIALGHGRALNAPLVTGRLLVAADIRPGQRVLLIGAATGYTAALLAALGASVVAVEEQADLLAAARAATDNPAIRWVEGPLAAGAPGEAPVDRIMIDGAIEQLPDALAAQHIDTRMTGRRARWLVGMALGALALSSQAQAETLQGALAKAYENNPTLTAARAGQRANDENVPIQKASGLPSVGASVDYQENLVIPGNSFVAPGRVLSAGSQLSVPIYQGGAMRNAVKAAEYRVEAGQSDLRATEASIFSQVVGAYMDVIRDQAIVQLNQKNVAVLKTNLQASSDRFEIGDLTRTDVAQSQARLALAEGDLRGAEANLIRSRENYVRAPISALRGPPACPSCRRRWGAVTTIISTRFPPATPWPRIQRRAPPLACR